MESYFPHLSSTGSAPSYSEVYKVYRQNFEQRVSDGTIRRIVFPYHFYGVIALIIYMCIPHKNNAIIYAARWPLLALVTWFEWRMIGETSGAGLGLGYPAGLLSAIVIMLSWTWLVFKRPQWDAKRIQRIQEKSTIEIKSARLLSMHQQQNEKLRQRKPTKSSPIIYSQTDLDKIRTDDDKDTYKYYWQSYPENIEDRIPWVFDLLFNYRGPGWNWAISSLPSPPPEVLRKLEGSVPENAFSNISSAGNKRFSTRYELLISRLSAYFTCYIILDIMKIVMMKDPYFLFGPTTYALPPYLQALPSSILRLYRLSLSVAAIVAGISIMFAQEGLIFCCLLGPRVIGQRAEPWYYPSEWGSFSNVLQKGLGGLWGNFWHQSFRLYFTAPTRYLIEKGFMQPGSFTTQIVSMIFAFGLSGFIHWAGSVSMLGNTNPSHIIIFFGLQGVGIMIQRGFCNIIFPRCKRFPKSIRYTGNLLFTLGWLYLTGCYVADDFARGGLWILELIPFSLLSILGFENQNTASLTWKDVSLKWHTGNNWWESGLIML